MKTKMLTLARCYRIVHLGEGSVLQEGRATYTFLVLTLRTMWGLFAFNIHQSRNGNTVSILCPRKGSVPDDLHCILNDNFLYPQIIHPYELHLGTGSNFQDFQYYVIDLRLGIRVLFRQYSRGKRFSYD